MSSLIDDLRQKEYDNALALLRQVAGCNFAVEDPDGDALSGAQVNTPRTTARTRTFNRTSQEGI
jgi:predicted negative regulator of RcsB-dependent stress response